MRTLRYLFIIPLCIIAWYVVLFMGYESLQFSGKYFCPVGFGSGTDCYAPAWPLVEKCFVVFWTGISAITTVLVAFFMAPAHKLIIAVAIYIIGFILASLIAIGSSDMLLTEWLSAVIAGMGSLVWARMHITKHSTSRH